MVGGLILRSVRRSVLTQIRCLGWVNSSLGQAVDHKMFFRFVCYLVVVWLISGSDGTYTFLKLNFQGI